MSEEYVRLSLRITDDEKQKLDTYAQHCGLTRTALIRQLCLGNVPKPRPPKEFWMLLDALYRVHNGFQSCAEYHPPALEVCVEIEQLALALQANLTTPEVI